MTDMLYTILTHRIVSTVLKQQFVTLARLDAIFDININFAKFGSDVPSLPSNRQRLSSGACLGDKREDNQNCSALCCCVRQLCTMIHT